MGLLLHTAELFLHNSGVSLLFVRFHGMLNLHYLMWLMTSLVLDHFG